MRAARRFLLLPLLSPLLAVLLVAAFQPRPPMAIRLLTWTTPRAPLGVWLSAAALGGAALSGASTALALRQGVSPRVRRRVTSRPVEAWPQSESDWDDDWSAGTPASARVRREQEPQTWSEPVGVVAPQRSPGDPAPTVAVPFRVLHRPSSSREWEPPVPVPVARAVETPSGASVAVRVDDEWGAAPAADEW